MQAVALMQWWAYYANTKKIDQRLLFAIPNGGARHIAVARKLKAEGVRAGIPDYFLAVPQKGFSGLFLELKAGGLGFKAGRLSEAQHDAMCVLLAAGYKTITAYGTDEAIRAVEGYLK